MEDQTNILSALTVRAEKDGETCYVVHFEKMPGSMKDTESLMEEAYRRIKKNLGDKITDKVYFRVHDFDESFDINGSGKRDFVRYQLEGVTDQAVIPKNEQVNPQYVKR